MLRPQLNLGIFAHVDAGKTTLTERLLFAAGAIDAIGSVDRGDTQTDSLALEQERGITIKSAVVSFDVGATTVNVVDTPGHPDFVAEVERAIGVLDGAILVVSAVEGVQSHTLILMRALQRLSVPTVIFVNKIDRAGADDRRVLHEITERLTTAIVTVNAVSDVGTRAATTHSLLHGAGVGPGPGTEVLAEHDETVLARIIDGGGALTRGEFRRALATQSRDALVHPVVFGSALTGAGVEQLTSGIVQWLPAARDDVDAELDGTIFKIDRGRRRDKRVYVRVRAGTLRVRDVVRSGIDETDRVTAIWTFSGGALVRQSDLRAGEIGVLGGLRHARIGDALGSTDGVGHVRHFAPPTLVSVVMVRREDRVRLGSALSRLAEEDPLINVHLDETRDEMSVSLYGEVQKEVIAETLRREFDLEVSFSETTTIYVERPLHAASALEVIAVAPNPFNATIGLRLEPSAPGSGVIYRRDPGIVGLMPNAYFTVVDETVRETLRQGIFGWEVIDCTVTMTRAGYWGKHGLGHQYFNKSMSSTGEDFRKLTPLIVARLLREAGTVVCEPIDWLHVDVPVESLDPVARVLRGMRVVVSSHTLRGDRCVLSGLIPAGRVHALQQRLPDLTRGEGVAETGFDHYEPVEGVAPVRPRMGIDPFDRVEYLKRLAVRGAKSMVSSSE